MKLLILLTLALTGQALSPPSHLTSADKSRITAVFVQNCDPETEMTVVHYSVLGLQLLGAEVPNKEQLCAAAAKLSDDTAVENLFAASGTAKALGCPFKLGPKATEALKSSLGEGSTTASIYFASKALVSTGAKLEKSVAKALANAIKKDDSLLSLGLAFHVAALLEGDKSSVFGRIEDALVQADEVDGRMLQFEGGLSVTSVVLSGAAALAAAAGKPLPLTGEQAVKFGNYLLYRKSVQQPKGCLHLLEGIESMTGAAQFTPLSISLLSTGAVGATNPNLLVSVTDLKGNSPGKLVVTADVTGEDGLLASKVGLVEAGAGYQLDLMALNPAAGFYTLTVSAEPAKPNPRLVGNTGVKLTVKVLTELAVKDAELKITDGDQSTAGRSVELQFPAKEASKVSVDYKERIALSFSLVDAAGAPLLVHQAFVRVACLQSAEEIVFVAEANRNKVYSFELDLGAEGGEIKQSGDYSLTLILGDAVVSNPVSWHIADLALTLPESGAKAEPGPYQLKPEIKHTFREPESRPPAAVSSLFTLLVLSPVLLLAALWVKLGANVGNLPLTLPCIGFHVGLGSIFGLYLLFWLQLNMFETVRYLALLGLVTFLAGNSLLASIAKKNK